ncbi:MAG: hypothetical protein HQ564_02600 [Candidatus Saganbacteria bacterium]|nr:hypothetical protein [Candidatus Saganbacteria bacterium]
MVKSEKIAPAIFDKSFDDLEKAIRVSARRQAVIAHNIANANTPGYKPLEFNEVLERAVESENNKKVVLEKELSDLSKNSLKYSSYIKIMSSKLGILRTIATQGKR